MFRETVNALLACVVTFVVCAVAYPAAVYGLGHTLFPWQARGSLIERDGKVVGSALIAQPFASASYFQPRPSAADYKADAASGSNLGTKNPDLRAKLAERAEALKATVDAPAPIDLVTASGSGLDPHISPEAAQFQAVRVAAARRLPVATLRALIDRHVDRSGRIIGAPPRVNVLRLNLDLDREATTRTSGIGFRPDHLPEQGASDASTSRPGAARASVPIGEIAAIRAGIEVLSGELSRVRKQVEAIPPRLPSGDLEGLEDRVSRLSADLARISPLVARVDAVNAKLESAGESLRSLQAKVGETRNVLKVISRRAPGRVRIIQDAG